MNIINVLNAEIQITDNIIIHKNDRFDDILKLVPTNKTWNVKTGYKWIYFNDIKIEDRIFDFGLCFHDEQLELIDFIFRNKYEKEFSWDNYDEKVELKRKKLYDQWLTREIGEERNFEWGSINAYFDAKGGRSGIGIRYK